jgi:hypothetical protein
MKQFNIDDPLCKIAIWVAPIASLLLVFLIIMLFSGYYYTFCSGRIFALLFVLILLVGIIFVPIYIVAYIKKKKVATEEYIKSAL